MNKNSIRNNIISETKINLDSNIYYKIYKKEKNKTININKFINKDYIFSNQIESPYLTNNSSKIKQKKFIKHKYMES